MKNCKYSVYANGDAIMFCQHKNNKDDHEGNCSKHICPLGKYTYEILEKNEKLLHQQKIIKQSLLDNLRRVDIEVNNDI